MKLITYNNIKFFQSDLLKKHNFIHAFFTKRSKNNNPKELQNQLNLTSNIHYLKQVHSNKIIQINNRSNLKPNIADCLITREKHQSLWIYTADCIPILIADTKTRNIAACHSGLKGLQNEIISKTLKRLIEIGSKKNNLIIAIGPSIRGDNYQTKAKDVENLIIQIMGKSNIKKELSLVKERQKELNPFFKKDSESDRIFIDIQSVAILQLYKEGIKESQINTNRLCTYSNPKLFNSFRRDKTNFRQWSCIYA